jgi:hypothetical protein
MLTASLLSLLVSVTDPNGHIQTSYYEYTWEDPGLEAYLQCETLAQLPRQGYAQCQFRLAPSASAY